jgi:periplasmic copper chaperone A
MNVQHKSALSLAATALAVALVGALGGCNAPAGASVQVSDAWARTSPSMATAGAAYMRIANTTTADDALVAASVDPSVATMVEIHETVAGQGGMMEMHPVQRIAVPAGGSVDLAPGGYHVMLMGLTAPLEVGSTIQIGLTFEKAGQISVTATVRETAP